MVMKRIFWIGLLILTNSIFCLAQRGTPSSISSIAIAKIASHPSQLGSAVAAMGDRVRRPGKEQTVLIGVLTDGEGPRPIRVTQELPTLITVEGANLHDSATEPRLRKCRSR